MAGSSTGCGLAARALSGEVGTGSPQKMRPLKDNQSEFRFHWNGIRSEDSYAGFERARPDFASRKPKQQGEASGGGDADDHRPGACSEGVTDDCADGRTDHLLHAADK